MFIMLVPSCCDKFETSCYLLVTGCMSLVPTALTRPVRNKLQPALLRAGDIRVVETTFCKSVDIYLFRLVDHLKKAVQIHLVD